MPGAPFRQGIETVETHINAARNELAKNSFSKSVVGDALALALNAAEAARAQGGPQ